MMYAATFGGDAPVNFALLPSALGREVDELIFVGNGLAIVDGAASSEGPHHFVYSDGTIREGSPDFRRLEAPDALTRHGLKLLRIEVRPKTIIGTFDWDVFIKAAILHETQALERFMKLILSYCASRGVGDRRLSAIASIRLRLAEISQIVTLTREMTEGTGAILSSASCREITVLISKATDLLIKTAGARSMLSDGLVEMQFFFTLFNNIYLWAEDERY